MKVVTLSNYFNHHQQPLSDALFQLTRGQYAFIATSDMPDQRRQLGYGENTVPEYVLSAYESREMYDRCMSLLSEADIVIAGSAPPKMLRRRIRERKLVFRYSESPLKNGPEWHKYPFRLLRWHWWNPPGSLVYLLCASAYAAGDYAKFGLFRNRAYRWGYFTETKQYLPEELLHKKDPCRILWAGRMLPLKHPEHALEAAKRLREEGYPFELTLVGMGEREPFLRERILQYGLQDVVRLAGAVPPRTVRQYMEGAGIFLFTSDRQEGWGAVLNEAMNSGCAVIASSAAGSAPFLIRDQQNGLLYESGNTDMLYDKLSHLLKHPQEQVCLGAAACDTITTLWNAETAARRLLCLAEKILAGEASPDLYDEGPCSRAEHL